MNQGYTKEECINALKRAARDLGKSPSVKEYRSLDIEPSARTMSKKFGSWPEAKAAAGLNSTKHGKNEAFVENRFISKSVDINYFREIDSPEKAYWLGFLFGDGSVRVRPSGGRVLSLEIQKSDIEHLRLFKNTLQSEHAIHERRNAVMIRIGDREFVDNLWEKGLTPSKTHDSSVPNLEEAYKPAFTRGIFDADGNVRARTSGNRWVVTSSSRDRLTTLRSWLPVPALISSHSQNDAFNLCVYQEEHLSELVQWMYPSGTLTEPALWRKKEIALMHVEPSRE